MAGRQPSQDLYAQLLKVWRTIRPGEPAPSAEQLPLVVGSLLSQSALSTQPAATLIPEKTPTSAAKPRTDPATSVASLCKQYAQLTQTNLSEAVGLPNLHQRECFSNAAIQCLAASRAIAALAKQVVQSSGAAVDARLVALAIVVANSSNAEAAKAVVEAIDSRIDTIVPDPGADAAGGQRMAGEFASKAIDVLGASKAVFSVTYTCTQCHSASSGEDESFSAVPLQASQQTLSQAWEFFLCREGSRPQKGCQRCRRHTPHTCKLQLINKPAVLALEIGRVVDQRKDRTHLCFHQGFSPSVHAPSAAGSAPTTAHYGLIGAAEHLGNYFSSGHWRTFSRRIGRSVMYDCGEKDAAGRPVILDGRDKFLCFDSYNTSSTPPEEKDWVTVSSQEVSFLLYELLPSGHPPFPACATDVQFRGKSHPVRREPGPARPVPSRGTAAAGEPAILKEPIQYRQLRDSLSPQEDEAILRAMIRFLCAGEEDSLFNCNKHLVLQYNPQLKDNTGGTVLAGEPQSGKTNAILLVAWLAHFVYDRFPILCVRGGGGINAREQLRDDIHKFNEDQIKSAHAQAWREVTKKNTPPPATELNKWKLYDVVGYGSILDGADGSSSAGVSYQGLFARGRAVVLLRMVTKHNIELITQTRKYKSAKRADRPSDLQQIATLYASYGRPAEDKKVPVEIIFDEADTLVQSFDKDYYSAEKGIYATQILVDLADDEEEGEKEDEGLLDTDQADNVTIDALDTEGARIVQATNLVNAVEHCLFVTATPTAIFLTTKPGMHMDVALLPIRQQGPAPYYGFNAARIKDKSRQIVYRGVKGGVVLRGGDSEDKDPGIMDMVKHMILTPGNAEQRVGLVHCERLVAKHDEIAQWIMSDDLAKEHSIVTLQHNGGAQGSKYGCVLRLSEFILMKNSGLASEFLLPASRSDQRGVVPYSVVDRRLITQKMRAAGDEKPRLECDIERELGAVYFPKRILLVDILDMIQRFKQKHLTILGRRLTVVIISGNMGNRGTVFKSTDRKLHLTDEYINMSPSTTVQYGVQMCARICGRYDDQPLLRLWATREQYDTMLAMFHIEHTFIEAARRAAETGTPIREAILKQKWPPLTWALSDRLKLVKANIDRHFMAGLVDELHDGSAIIERGREMTVAIPFTSTGYVHPRLEHIFELNSYLEHRRLGNLDFEEESSSSSSSSSSYRRADAEPEDRLFPAPYEEDSESVDTDFAGGVSSGAGAGAGAGSGSGKRSSKSRSAATPRASARPVLEQFDRKVVCSVSTVARFDTHTLADYLHKQCAMESFRQDQVNENNIATEVKLFPLPPELQSASDPACAPFLTSLPGMSEYHLLAATGQYAHQHKTRFNHNPLLLTNDDAAGGRLGLWWVAEVDGKRQVVAIVRRFTTAQLRQLPEPMAVLWHEVELIDGVLHISVRARRAAENPDDIMGHMYRRLKLADEGEGGGGGATTSKRGKAHTPTTHGTGAGAGAGAAASRTRKRGREQDAGEDEDADGTAGHGAGAGASGHAAHYKRESR